MNHAAASVLDSLSVPEAPDRRFCNFIYSNPRCSMRNAFFQALSVRDHDSWQTSKRAVLGDYRFTIAFENEEVVGYTTEKMIDAWLADSVPIYWGNPAADIEFPEGSYLSLYEAGTMSRLVDQVLEAQHNPERYAQLRAANPFRTGRMSPRVEQYRADLTAFGQRVRQDAVAHRGRSRTSVARQAVAMARVAQSGFRRRVSASIR